MLGGSCREEKAVTKLLSVMSSTLKEMRNGGEVSVTQDYTNGHQGGGVRDLYGEDSATEDQLITPWSFSVSR